MAIITQGLMGGISGKTGPLIGSSWKGKAVLRAKPVYKKNRAFTQLQLNQQEKFKLMRNFLIGIEYLLLLAFKTGNKQRNGFHEAFSVNMREAIAGEVSPFRINYSNIRLSNGSITVLQPPVMMAEPGNKVKLVWSHPLQIGMNASDVDKAIAVFYAETDNLFLMSSFDNRRQDGELLFDATLFTGKEVHVWFLYLSDNEAKASKSQYLGRVMVTAL
ncbi:MAG: DUF6266 family protein [Bacteroidota bacterium]